MHQKAGMPVITQAIPQQMVGKRRQQPLRVGVRQVPFRASARIGIPVIHKLLVASLFAIWQPPNRSRTMTVEIDPRPAHRVHITCPPSMVKTEQLCTQVVATGQVWSVFQTNSA